MAGLYVVGVWLVIQVADISFPAWGVPETALRYLFIAAAIVFPVTLVFSWYYDITSGGIVRTEPAGEAETVDLKLKRADYVVLSALLAIGMAVLFGTAEKIQEEIRSLPAPTAAMERRENSIAVLPLTNLDTSPDTAFFSDGITEEILHRLSTLGALHVLASTSSFAFRDSEEGPAGISEKLGVRYLLQGSIRRDNDYVRVTAKLVDAAGFLVWSQTFDRKLEGIFAIQTQIASTVSTEIINEIVPPQDLPAGRTTENMEAYNEYLIGKAVSDARTMDWHESAQAAFRRAIELDDGFAPAYAGLAISLYIGMGTAHLEEVKSLAEKSLQLDPELALGNAILGLYLGEIDEDYERGIPLLRRAIALDPSLSNAYNWLSLLLAQQGLLTESRMTQDRGLEIDPLNPPLVANVAVRESDLGNFDRAEQLLGRLVNLPQPPAVGFWALYGLYDTWGRFADALEIARQYARLSAAAGDPDYQLLAFAYANLGMIEDADYWINLALEGAEDELDTLDLKYDLLRTRDANSDLGNELRRLVDNTELIVGVNRPWTFAQFGLVYIQLRDFGKGSEQLDFGIRLYQGGPDGAGPAEHIDVAAIDRSPDDVAFMLHLLACSYRQVGRDGDADAILRELTDHFDMDDNALQHALTGDAAGALRILQTKTGPGWGSSYGPGKYYEIVNDPAWAETIRAPEFQAFLAGMRADVDRQRAIVEAADAAHDFRAEIEQLLENRITP